MRMLIIEGAACPLAVEAGGLSHIHIAHIVLALAVVEVIGMRHGLVGLP